MTWYYKFYICFKFAVVLRPEKTFERNVDRLWKLTLSVIFMLYIFFVQACYFVFNLIVILSANLQCALFEFSFFFLPGNIG